LNWLSVGKVLKRDKNSFGQKIQTVPMLAADPTTQKSFDFFWEDPFAGVWLTEAL
jgi:hypothetical protein